MRASLRQTRREVPDILRLAPRGRYLYRERGGEAGSCSDSAALGNWGLRSAMAESATPKASKAPAERLFRSNCEPARKAVRRNPISRSVQYPVKSLMGGSDDCAGCTRKKPDDWAVGGGDVEPAISL